MTRPRTAPPARRCPFCGALPEQIMLGPGYFRVICSAAQRVRQACPVGPYTDAKVPATAWRRWNTRFQVEGAP